MRRGCQKKGRLTVFGDEVCYADIGIPNTKEEYLGGIGNSIVSLVFKTRASMEGVLDIIRPEVVRNIAREVCTDAFGIRVHIMLIILNRVNDKYSVQYN